MKPEGRFYFSLVFVNGRNLTQPCEIPTEKNLLFFFCRIISFYFKIRNDYVQGKAYSAFVYRVNSDGNEDAQLIKEVISLSKVGKRKR